MKRPGEVQKVNDEDERKSVIGVEKDNSIGDVKFLKKSKAFE